MNTGRSDHLNLWHAAWMPAVLLAALFASAGTPQGAAAADKPVSHRLPDGRLVAPAGKSVATGNFAVGLVNLSDDLLVEAAGASAIQSIQCYSHRLEPRGAIRFSKYTHPWHLSSLLSKAIANQSLFQSMTAGPDRMLYAAGGVSDNLLAIKLRHGRVKLMRRYTLLAQPFPKNQYPFVHQGPPGGENLFYPDAVAISGKFAYVTGMLSNSLAKINLRTGKTTYTNAGAYPYAVLSAGRCVAVSDWGADSVRLIQKSDLAIQAIVHIGPPTGMNNRLPGIHPTALAYDPAQKTVWVACANADRLSEISLKNDRVIHTIADVPYRNAPPGSFPDALTIWDGKLFAANAGNDDVAVFNLSTDRCAGLISTGWYPTGVCIHKGHLFVTSAKGLGYGPNPSGHWIGDCMPGMLQSISLRHLALRLPQWTHQTLNNLGMTHHDRQALASRNATAIAWLHKHIRHVVFILRENKTFDEDFGAYSRAGKWADPKLDLYNRRELPNLYSLADKYSLMVNYKVDGEVTAQGHQWTTSGEDGDFVQRTWPMYYSGRGLEPNPGWTQALAGVPFSPQHGLGGTDNPYSASTDLTTLGAWSNPWISYPNGMFIFNDLLMHHVSFEDFGEFVSRSEIGNISAGMRTHIGRRFPGWNRFILDTYRAGVVKHFLKQHATHLPRLMYMWLPDDHTAGNARGFYTPDYYVANNDQATGEIVAALSKLKCWRHTLVFITEDDAQSGCDHISAHRSLALVVGPWVKPGLLIDHPYSQINILRTMEAIAGVPPMSQWDANAEVIGGIWASKPNVAIYHCAPLAVKMALNPGRPQPENIARLQAGRTGHWLSPGWLKAHARADAKVSLSAYGPTTLLKVPGPVQLKQEWIACKGKASYERLMAYVRKLARSSHESIYQIIASDGQ